MTAAPKHPIVIAGPFMAQSLDIWAKSGLCKSTSYEWIYGSPNMTAQSPETLCMVAGLGNLDWNMESKRSVQNPDFLVQPHGGVESFDAFSSFGGAQLWDLQMLPRLRSIGYEDDVSLFGHAYDWRLGVHDWEATFFPTLQKQIESGIRQTGEKAVLTGLSMGCPYLHTFMSWTRRTLDPEWPEKHIHAFVPIAGPFNGAVMALQATLASILGTWDITGGECPRCQPAKVEPTKQKGTNIIDWLKAFLKQEAFDVLDDVLKKVVWEWPSLYYISTGVDHSTDPPTDPVVVHVKEGSGAEVLYRASQMPELLRKFGRAKHAAMYEEYSLGAETTRDPGVPTHCIISHNIQTQANISFAAGSRKLEKATMTLDDGDQTVDEASLLVCTRWKSTRKTYRIPGVKHGGMLDVGQAVDVLEAVATEDEHTLEAWKEPKFEDVECKSKSSKVTRAELLVAEGVAGVGETTATEDSGVMLV